MLSMLTVNKNVDGTPLKKSGQSHSQHVFLAKKHIAGHVY
jgi:hypothetical protein